MSNLFRKRLLAQSVALSLPLVLLAGCNNSNNDSSSTSTTASASSPAIASGTLLVSRTNYAGSASTVAVGQALPGGGTAIADGGYPEVFENETADGSFGVTSPIFLDQVNAGTGAITSTMAIDPTQMASSFASKSELALNESLDGSAITFMGYKSGINTLDVSNANTDQAYDSTNPVSSIYQRAVAQVNLSSGAVTVTGVNAYSGNNGRAAVLANGLYYMVGNAGNGSGNGDILSILSENTGVQSISASNPGGGNTSPVGLQVGTGAYGSTTGYQFGFALSSLVNPSASPAANYADDKTGKDDNFRGLTVFNNTLYVSKGSGSNGVNTVYQVGPSGALANGGVLSNALITVLPGFNALSEKVAEAKATLTATPHPFGLWFANATTLFVADEGDGNLEGASGKVTTFAGLQEWTYAAGKWSLIATYQGGLNINNGTSIATVNNPSSATDPSWHVYTDGLRNLTGKTNADGSVTLYATTSTVSDDGNHDLGSDPNQVVTITVPLATAPSSTTPATPAFTVVESASAGQRLGGVLVVK